MPWCLVGVTTNCRGHQIFCRSCLSFLAQIFCRSCLSFLALFCCNKLSWCQQCSQTHSKTGKIVMASLFPSIQAPTTQTLLVSLQTIAYIQALGIHSLSYTMPLKPLAAKAFVLNRNLVDDVVSRDGTRFHRRQILHWFSQNAGLRLWRHCGLGGCISSSFRPALQEALHQRRWVHQYHSRHQLLLRQQPGRMVPAPLRSLPRLLQVRVPKLAPAILRPARAPCSALRLLKIKLPWSYPNHSGCPRDLSIQKPGIRKFEHA